MTKASPDPIRRFAQIASLPQDRLDLAEGALAIAAGGDRELDPAVWLERLNGMASGVGDLDELVHRLFWELGFHGNTDDYYDPSNSFLHRVIERRRGIPITLSVLLIAVGVRAGIDLHGVGMPGHFLVQDAASGRYIDPFNRGQMLDDRGCQELFRTATGAGLEVPFGAELLPLVTKVQILDRILANLKACYRRQGSHSDLEWVLRMRLALPSVASTEVLELVQALVGQGKFIEAAQEMERRADDDPEASETLRGRARAIRARLN